MASLPVLMVDFQDAEATRLRLQPGDVLLLSIPQRLTAEASRCLREQLTDLFPEQRVMVLQDGAKLSVAGQVLPETEIATLSG